MLRDGLGQLRDELQASHRRLEALAHQTPTTRKLSRLISRLERRIARPPRIVLLGEFNAGKTTLANALIGSDILPTSILANTRIPVHVSYSPAPFINVEMADRTVRPLSEDLLPGLTSKQANILHVGLPVERLREFELIDTPGLASGMTRLDPGNHEACRRADIAIWCTATSQAWKATEREAWRAVPSRLRGNALLVATLADVVYSIRDRKRVEERLRYEASPHFSSMIMVAAAEIAELRKTPAVEDFEDRWIEAGGAALDGAVADLLDTTARAREVAMRRVLARTVAKMTVQLERTA